MHSPPQYRMGGEASGTPRSAHSTPDPARPASAGMYDGTVRPDRSVFYSKKCCALFFF